jgi:hypothetical protein
VLKVESDKIVSWRGKTIRTLLEIKDSISAFRLAEAMAIRDEYFATEYHKIWISADQLALVLILH